MQEPESAFSCSPPDQHIRAEYGKLFGLEGPLPTPASKLFFDRSVSLVALLLALPILAMLYLATRIEGWLRPQRRGPFIVGYRAATAGKPFKKLKICTLRWDVVDRELARNGDWHAYAAESQPNSLTSVGRVVKALYLDELPQLYSIVRGDMSLVGPRPLAWHHYERDIGQGNVTRRLIKAGLLGPNQALKGTADFGAAKPEYAYLQAHLERSGLSLLWIDLKLILRGILVVFRARGL